MTEEKNSPMTDKVINNHFEQIFNFYYTPTTVFITVSGKRKNRT